MKKVLAITFALWAVAASAVVLGGAPSKNGDLSNAEMAATLGSGCCSLATQNDCAQIDECTKATQVAKKTQQEPPACPSIGKDFQGITRYTCKKTGDPNMRCDTGTVTCYFNQYCTDGGVQYSKKIGDDQVSCVSDQYTDCRTCSGGNYTGGVGTKSDETCVEE